MSSKEDKRMLKRYEIVSYIQTLNAPLWFRAGMIFDERWLDDDFPIQKALSEADEKVRVLNSICNHTARITNAI